MPPLFRSDPEESFNLWMQSRFPGASLSREDAIRQWLATPQEARVQRVRDHRAESAKSNGSEIPDDIAIFQQDHAKKNSLR